LVLIFFLSAEDQGTALYGECEHDERAHTHTCGSQHYHVPRERDEYGSKDIRPTRPSQLSSLLHPMFCLS